MSDSGRRAGTGRIGAVALGLLLAAVVPATAASSVRMADGAVLTVDEAGGKRASAAASEHRSRMLVFTVENEEGARSAFVASTIDPAFDESPVLAIDPRSGRPVLIWSRFDGAAMKLAWSRFDAGVWSEARFLTFGPGDDRTPALGTSAAGSYLFWRGAGESVLHAPIDLETGRFFAAPKVLPIPEVDRTPSPGVIPRNPLSSQGGTDAPIVPPHTNGGTDAPVIICQNPPCPQTNGAPDVPLGPSTGSSSTVGTTGGTDAPVIICQEPPCIQKPDVALDVPLAAMISSSSPSLSVFSDPACGSQILLIGSPRGRTLQAVEFAGAGRITPAGRVRVPAGLTPMESIAGSGSTLLEAACR